MSKAGRPAWRGGLIVRAVAVLALFGWASQAASSVWIDSTVGELKTEEKVAVAHPAAVQLLVEFQRDGADLPKALRFVAPIVTDEVKRSGVVASTSETPVAGGARLSVLINDIPDKGAAGKGFTAGLTLGLAGVVAGDSYDIVLTYVPAEGAAPIVRTLHHRIVYKFGNKTLPPNLAQVKNLEIAIKTVLHQSLAHGLNQIAGDPAFAQAPAPATQIPAKPDAAAPAAQ